MGAILTGIKAWGLSSAKGLLSCGLACPVLLVLVCYNGVMCLDESGVCDVMCSDGSGFCDVLCSDESGFCDVMCSDESGSRDVMCSDESGFVV